MGGSFLTFKPYQMNDQIFYIESVLKRICLYNQKMRTLNAVGVDITELTDDLINLLETSISIVLKINELTEEEFYPELNDYINTPYQFQEEPIVFAKKLYQKYAN